MRTAEQKRDYERKYYATMKAATAGTKLAEYAASKERKRLRVQSWRLANPDKIRASRERRKANRDVVKDRMRLRKWAWKRKGATDPTRPVPAICDCCGRPPNGQWKTLNMDHCHVTGEFRGWLCHGCNVGIGALGDQLPGIMQAASYLLRYGTHADLLGKCK